MHEREVRVALARHPATRVLAASPLSVVPGGLSNRAWRAEHAGGSYFVRLAARDAERLGVDRTSECALLATVAAAGLAPEVITCDPSVRLLVTRFVAGRHWSRADAHEPRNLRRIGETLRRLHALPSVPGVHTLDFRVQAARLEAGLVDLGPLDAGVKRTAEAAKSVLAARGSRVTLCHNDLHHLNVLDDGERLWLVDWEYGGVGDPLFDLAGLFCLHDASPAQQAIVLEAYGQPDLATNAELSAARCLFDYVQWLWFRLWIATHPGADAEYSERAAVLAQRLRESPVLPLQ